MGPYPHDAARAAITDDNPMGTDGFEFVEYASTEPKQLGELFEQMGFTAVARHRSRDVTLYRQGDVNFIVNAEPDSFARRFAEAHGPCACAMAFRVTDAKHAFERARASSARSRSRRASARWSSTSRRSRASAAACCTSSIATATRARSTTSTSAGPASARRVRTAPACITSITSRTTSTAATWRSGPTFYERLFNFRQIRYFDIEGKLTGLFSKALTSPDGKIRIPINESADDQQPDRGVPARLSRRRHPARRLRLPRRLRDRRDAASRAACRSCRRRPMRTTPRSTSACPITASRSSAARARPPDRRRGRRRRARDAGAAADLHEERHRPDLLRADPAQGRRRLRRGQLQGAVREHRAGPDRRGVIGRERDERATLQALDAPTKRAWNDARRRRRPARRSGRCRESPTARCANSSSAKDGACSRCWRSAAAMT